MSSLVEEENDNGDVGIDMVVTMNPSVRALGVGGCWHLRKLQYCN